LQTPIELVVGLGNPGPEYAKTRHNAGAWFVEKLAADFNLNLKNERKFTGLYTDLETQGRTCRLLVPTTFMNLSGQSVSALASFYKIPPQAILVAHDELDFPAGIARIKYAGGHGGHNGVSDIIRHLNTHDFYRLRLGIGHPGDRAHVTPYVLNRPPLAEMHSIQDAIDRVITVFDDLLQGKIAEVMQHLHQASV